MTAGCITLTDEAARVRVTDRAGEVEACTSLGAVETGEPFIVRSQAIAQLRNATARADGDTLLLTGTGWKKGSTGKAYRCGAEKKK